MIGSLLLQEPRLSKKEENWIGGGRSENQCQRLSDRTPDYGYYLQILTRNREIASQIRYGSNCL